MMGTLVRTLLLYHSIEWCSSVNVHSHLCSGAFGFAGGMLAGEYQTGEDSEGVGKGKGKGKGKAVSRHDSLWIVN